MREVFVTLKGEQPLLMHADDINACERIEKWRQDPANKTKSVAGDDRSPAWTWIGYLYRVAGKIGIPADNILTMIREGAAKVPMTRAQGGRSAAETWKKRSQSGIIVANTLWEIVTKHGNTISFDDVSPLLEEENFPAHIDYVENLGFELHLKRAKIGSSKHVRVRPYFDAGWSVSGNLFIVDEGMTMEVLESILVSAGKYCGLCDWRPSSPKSPGPYGMFSVEIKS